MAFYVGQKVVCVDAHPDFLLKGVIYTISRVGLLTHGETGVNLAEVDTSACPHDVGFRATRFRPLVERKTDISIFTDMLRTADEQVPA